MFCDFPARPGKLKDTCWACSMPIYEQTPHVTYLGVCLHTDCYEAENIPKESASSPDEAPPE